MILVVMSLFTPFFLLRVLQWVSIVQQKEYRFDRLHDCFATGAGRQAVLQLFPRGVGMQYVTRPRLTLRSLLTVAYTLALLSVVLYGQLLVVGMLQVEVAARAALLFVMSTATLFLIPFFALLALLPTTAARAALLLYQLRSAYRKVSNSQSTVIGITGSYGKTSTKLLLTHVLSQKHTVFTTPKSYNNLYSVSREINRYFANQKYAVIEYGAYQLGDIAKLAYWVKPHMAIITGFTVQHIGLFGSGENIIAAKSELVAALEPKSAIYFDGSNEGVKKIVAAGDPDSVHTHTDFAQFAGAELKQKITAAGTVSLKWRNHTIKTQLVGEQYVSTCAAVIKVCLDLGLSEQQIVTGLESFVPTENFVRSYSVSDSICIDDAVACNPAGFKKICDLADTITSKQHAQLLFGGIVDLGPETEAVHTALAKRAARSFSHVWYCGTVGKPQFAAVFGKRCTPCTADQATDIFSKGIVVVLEGKMPHWVDTYIAKHKH